MNTHRKTRNNRSRQGQTPVYNIFASACTGAPERPSAGFLV